MYIMACPYCGSSDTERVKDDEIKCNECGTRFPG